MAFCLIEKLPIVFERFYLHVLWVQVYSFLHLIDYNNKNKKKKYKGTKNNNSNPSTKIYELLLSFVR